MLIMIYFIALFCLVCADLLFSVDCWITFIISQFFVLINLLFLLIICETALSGDYVNFGVFELYGDRALIDSLDIALKMALSIPLADILAFQKVRHWL